MVAGRPWKGVPVANRASRMLSARGDAQAAVVDDRRLGPSRPRTIRRAPHCTPRPPPARPRARAPIEMAKCGMPCMKIGGAVERIDDPAMGLVGALDGAALLHQKAVAGTRLGELLEQGLLGLDVGGGDEIGWALCAKPADSRPRRNRAPTALPALRAAAIMTLMVGEVCIGAWELSARARAGKGAEPRCTSAQLFQIEARPPPLKGRGRGVG